MCDPAPPLPPELRQNELSAANVRERRFELRFLDSANFKPYGEHIDGELRLVVGSRRKAEAIDRLLVEGWGLASVERVV